MVLKLVEFNNVILRTIAFPPQGGGPWKAVLCHLKQDRHQTKRVYLVGTQSPRWNGDFYRINHGFTG